MVRIHLQHPHVRTQSIPNPVLFSASVVMKSLADFPITCEWKRKMQVDACSAAVVVKLDLQLPSMFVIERQREAYSIRGSMFLRGA